MVKLVSVIVPIYNTEPYLEKCLSSIKNQEYKNIEVLLVDDGSTDGSSYICQRFCKEDERFRYLYKENNGLGSARNYGINNSKGEYLCFIDSDDWLEQDYINYLLEGFSTDNVDIVFCNKMVNGIIENNVFPSQIIEKRNFFIEYAKGNILDSCCVKMFSRRVTNKLLFDERMYFLEDMMYTIHCFDIAERIVAKELPKYNVYIRFNSLSHSVYIYEKQSAHLASKFYVLDRLLKKCPEEKVLEVTRLKNLIIESLESRVNFSCYDIDKIIYQMVEENYNELIASVCGDPIWTRVINKIMKKEKLNYIRYYYLWSYFFNIGKRTGKEKKILLKKEIVLYLRR